MGEEEGPGASALHIPSSCPPTKTSQVLLRHLYLSAITFVPTPSPAWLSSRDQWRRDRVIHFFMFIFASNTFLIIKGPCWKWGRKLKDIKPATPIDSDTFSSSCSDSLLSSSDSYPFAPAELLKVPAQPCKLSLPTPAPPGCGSPKTKPLPCGSLQYPGGI